ncbi:hypothetical protein [Methylobacterium sp. JK268]
MLAMLKSNKKSRPALALAPLPADQLDLVSGGDKGGECHYDSRGTLVCSGAEIKGSVKK